MKSFIVSLAVGQLAGLTVAAPSPMGNRRCDGHSTFALSQIRNDKFTGHDAPAALIDAFAKYGQGPPPAMRQAIQLNPKLNRKFGSRFTMATGEDTASVPNHPPARYDVEYVVPVEIGTPPQTINLNLDTGSADFWVFSTDTYEPQVQGQTLYDPNASETSKRLQGESWNIVYGDGTSAGGVVYSDNVRLGNTSFADQAVQSAVMVSAGLAADPFASGVLGMSRSSANTVRPTQQKTYIENVSPSLKEPLFTANLFRQKAGTYDFGYIDDNHYTGPIQYFDIDPNSPYWEFSIDGYRIGNTKNPVRPFRWRAIADTGTSLLLLPTNMVKDYYKQVADAFFDAYNGMMVFPCASELPDFTIAQANYKGVIPGHYMNYGPSNETHCYGGIQDSGTIGFAILGDVALKAQFAIFDWGNKRVGLANKPAEAQRFSNTTVHMAS